MTTTPYPIEPLVLPAGIDAPDAGDFLLALPPAAGTLEALERAALPKGEEYELLRWTDRCPAEYAAQLAVLMSREWERTAGSAVDGAGARA